MGLKIRIALTRFKNSKLLLATVMFIIGYTVCYLSIEAPKYYQWVKIGYAYAYETREIMVSGNNQDMGDVSQAVSYLDNVADQGEELSSPETLINYIHLKESTNGKNNYSKCEAQGLYNEYGYGIPGDGKYLCFEKGEDRKEVERWIKDKKEKGLSDKELLCHYNTGTITEDCPYANNYL